MFFLKLEYNLGCRGASGAHSGVSGGDPGLWVPVDHALLFSHQGSQDIFIFSLVSYLLN